MPPLYDVTGHPLLSGKFAGLPDSDQREAYNVLAEYVLGLKAPAKTDAGAVDNITYAVVRQINLMLNEGIEPLYLKSVSNTVPGNTTAYRDRTVDPLARQLVDATLGIRRVRLTPTGPGV